MTNVLFVIADSKEEYNSANWRCDMPMDAINTTKAHRAQKMFIKDWAEKDDKTLGLWADIIVLQRNVVAGGLWATGEWLARGKKVLVDLDDGYEYMPQSVISANFWINNLHKGKDGKMTALPFSPLEHLVMGIKLCSAITTPSSVIVNDRSKMKKAVLLRNYPRSDLYIEAAKSYNETKVNDGKITIGWGGGGSHFDSFKETGVLTAIARVMEKRKNVEFLVMGPREVGFLLTNLDRRLHGRVKAEPWGAYSAWPDRLARLDIAVAPLHGNYDKRRSWLKGIEYTLAGIPWVGTDYGVDPQPYCEFPRYHLVRNNAGRWEAALLDLVDNLAEAKCVMAQEQEWARQFDLYANAENIVKILEEA